MVATLHVTSTNSVLKHMMRVPHIPESNDKQHCQWRDKELKDCANGAPNLVCGYAFMHVH